MSVQQANPNHPVTQRAAGEDAIKLLAICMWKLKQHEVIVTSEDLEQFSREDLNVMVRYGRTTLDLKLIDSTELKRLAKLEGGLPT